MSRLGEIGMLAAFYLNVQVIRDLGKQSLRSLSKLSHETTPQFFTVGHYAIRCCQCRWEWPETMVVVIDIPVSKTLCSQENVMYSRNY